MMKKQINLFITNYYYFVVDKKECYQKGKGPPKTQESNDEFIYLWKNLWDNSTNNINQLIKIGLVESVTSRPSDINQKYLFNNVVYDKCPANTKANSTDNGKKYYALENICYKGGWCGFDIDIEE